MSTLLLVMVVVAIFACGLVIMMTGVRLTWAMSRDERFPGWRQWNQISPRFHTPLKATVMFFVLAELILAAFSQSQNALFTLFGAATLLPAIIYAATVVLYLIKRKQLPDNGKFDLGAWEKPILIVAVVWLVFELALFRDASFKDAWLYVLVMVVIGAIYLGVLLARRGRHGLAMPDMLSIDAELDHVADAGHAMTYVLAIDQGTSGTKAIVVDEAGQVIAIAEVALRPDYLPGGGVEQDPEALLDSVVDAGRRALDQAGVTVSAVALANQGETVLAWDRRTGRPLTPAIVWQDRRAESICAALAGSADTVAAQTGLVLDPYFSAPKMAWIRENLTRDGVGHHHRHLADPPAVRCVRHRRLHRQPVAAARPGRHRVEPRAAGAVRPGRRGAARHRCQRPHRRRDRRLRAAGHPGRRADRRPAGRAARRELPGTRNGEVHLRHRCVPARPTRRHAPAVRMPA